MIQKFSHSTIYVLDQDRAKECYTERLGFEVREDARMDNFRWLTVGPKTQTEMSLVLMPIAAGPTMNEEKAKMLRELVESGALGGGVLATPDCRKTYEELKAKGVQFAREPTEMPYGIEAVLLDDSGNFFSLTQRL